MQIKIESKDLGDVAVVVPDVFRDDRGFFTETFRADEFQELGLPTQFVQDNHSRSAKGVVGGLHFQWEPPMGKIMRVTAGAAFLVAVDIRKGSPTLGQWVGVEATAENRRSVWAPAGFARGFCSLPMPQKFSTSARASTTARPSPGSSGTIPRLALVAPDGRDRL